MPDDMTCEIRENGRRCKRPPYALFRGHPICYEHWNRDGKDGYDVVKELGIKVVKSDA